MSVNTRDLALSMISPHEPTLVQSVESGLGRNPELGVTFGTPFVGSVGIAAENTPDLFILAISVSRDAILGYNFL